MLAVEPVAQGRGLGRALIDAAELHARSGGASVMHISVVNLRSDLLAYYGRLGYIATGINIAELPAPSLGFVYLPALLWVALASRLTAPLGAKATHYLRVGLLRKLFAVLLFALATRLLFKVL